MVRDRHSEQLALDGLTFVVRWSSRRRTIGITVHDDGRLVVAAPVGCRPRRVEEAVRQKLPWVRRKVAESAARPATPDRRWVDGELLHYLGVGYPLRVVGDGGVPVRLHRGAFLMASTAATDGPRHMTDWYRAHAEPLLARRVDSFRDAVGVSPATVGVADMGRRWGTCDARGRLRFNWRIVLFPRPAIDYVVVHELAHLRELNHGPCFWAHVERVVPDYRERRTWLREQAAGYRL